MRMKKFPVWRKLIAAAGAAVLAAQSLQGIGILAGAEDETISYFSESSDSQDISDQLSDEALEAQYALYQNEDPLRFQVIDDRAQAAAPDIASLTHNERFAGATMYSGIDVSKYQADINWSAVASDAVDFSIVRVGYRGYGSEGTLVYDPKYRANIEGASAAGLQVGLYFFTQAITVEEAVEEANFVLSGIRGYSISLPIYIDIEKVSSGVGRLDSTPMTIAERTAICEAFCETIEAAGYRAGIYASKSYFLNYLDPDYLSTKYSIWLAHYTNQTSYKGEYDIWQFSDSGTVAGIKGNVDRNVLYSAGGSFFDPVSIPDIEPVAFPVSEQVMAVGDTIIPIVSGDGEITYSSSDESVATVDSFGVITALRKGTATVTATSTNGTSDSMEITVSLPVHVALNYSSLIFTKTDNSIIAGDANGDGVLNAVDASEILVYAGESGVGIFEEMTAANRQRYDADGNGVVNAVDACLVLEYTAATGLDH